MTALSPAALRTLIGFGLLFVALYGAYGSESAFLPGFLLSHGLGPVELGVVLAAGTVIRIMAGPLAGHVADRTGRSRTVLAAAAVAAGTIGSAYIVSYGFGPLLALGSTHAAATAPLASLTDTLAVRATSVAGLPYGWLRGMGSAAFVCGTLVSGQLVERLGLASIIVVSSTLFAVAGLVATRVPAEAMPAISDRRLIVDGVRALLRLRAYQRMLIVAALVIGSHAMNDTFAFVLWSDNGLSGPVISLLWSESVAAEAFVFFLFGPFALARLGPGGAAALSATAGLLRWLVAGATTALPVLVGLQALHGLTFALMHLVAMHVIATTVPARLSATAQTVYGTFALGAASAALTLASGYVYAQAGIRAYWSMVPLCAAALLLSRGLAGGSGDARRPLERLDPSIPIGDGLSEIGG